MCVCRFQLEIAYGTSDGSVDIHTLAAGKTMIRFNYSSDTEEALIVRLVQRVIVRSVGPQGEGQVGQCGDSQVGTQGEGQVCQRDDSQVGTQGEPCVK